MLIRFIFKLLIFGAIILTITGSINYYADPANLFGNKKYETKIADYFISGFNVANLYYFDQRRLHTYWISKIRDSPDIIVLGASHVWLLDSTYFKGRSVKNHFMRGETLEDAVTVIYQYEKRNIKPKTVILGIEPFWFNPNGAEDWKDWGRDYNAMREKMKLSKIDVEGQPIVPKQVQEIFSFSYLQSSLKYLFIRQNKRSDFSPTHRQEDSVDLMFHKDGTIAYSYAQQAVSNTEVDKIVEIYLNERPIHTLEGYTEVSGRSVELLRTFTRYLKAKGIEVVITLTPYHPRVYEYLSRTPEYKPVFESEKIVRQVALEENIRVIGGLNPGEFGLSKNDFIDALHLRCDASKKLYRF